VIVIFEQEQMVKHDKERKNAFYYSLLPFRMLGIAVSQASVSLDRFIRREAAGFVDPRMGARALVSALRCSTRPYLKTVPA